jgi:hypothetical protein
MAVPVGCCGLNGQSLTRVDFALGFSGESCGVDTGDTRSRMPDTDNGRHLVRCCSRAMNDGGSSMIRVHDEE